MIFIVSAIMIEVRVNLERYLQVFSQLVLLNAGDGRFMEQLSVYPIAQETYRKELRN